MKHPAPWKSVGEGCIVDANSEQVADFGAGVNAYGSAEKRADFVVAIVNAANRANTAFFAGHDMVKPMAELNAALTKAGVR